MFTGRTVPTFRTLLEEMIKELSVFRRALRGEDRSAFDSLMNKAREHASSSTVAVLDPMDSVFLSILIEHQKELSSLREVVANVPAGHKVRPGDRHNNEMD